jgi:hypothetical protein
MSLNMVFSLISLSCVLFVLVVFTKLLNKPFAETTPTEIPPKANARLGRIQKISRCVRLFLLYGIPALILCFFVSGFFVSKSWLDNYLHNTPEGIELLKQQETFSAHQMATFTEMITSLLLFLFWYRTALKLFGCFEKGILFTGETVRYIQILGGIYVGKFLLRLIFSFFIPLNLTLNDLFAGLLIIFIGWLIDEARKIREEQELTI